MKSQKITLPKTISRLWYQVDVSMAPLGRVASQIARLLRGKHKRQFTPHLDMGDFVVAVNAGNIQLSGRKLLQKKYFRHSGYLGGIKSVPLKTLKEKDPAAVLRRAVYSMLDDVKFRKAMLRRLKIFKDASHNYKIDKYLNL